MSQGFLFPTRMLPEGFVYEPEFLTTTEEVDLLSSIRQLNFHGVDFHGYQAKRRIVEYGLNYDFESRRTSRGRPFPDFLLPICQRVAKFIRLPSDSIAEAIVTEYAPGAPIGWHRDAPQFEVIVGISLLNECRMRLKPFHTEGKGNSVILEPRSIYVLSGAVRWNFQHSILPVKNLRYSVTFRTLRQDFVHKDVA